MLGRIKWAVRIVLFLAVALFLHYVLPQHDIVRITNTYNKLMVIGSNGIFYSSGDSGSAETGNTRDIRFIDAAFPNGKLIVYRNEDTGWIWPPYFKYDSSTLQAEATDLKSDAANPKWVSVTHYGWRTGFITIFPNAVNVKPVAGPDVTIIPWVNIIVLTFLAFCLLMIRRMWMQFRERSIDPALESVGDTFEQMGGQAEMAGKRAQGVWGRFVAWIGTWRGKP